MWLQNALIPMNCVQQAYRRQRMKAFPLSDANNRCCMQFVAFGQVGWHRHNLSHQEQLVKYACEVASLHQAIADTRYCQEFPVVYITQVLHSAMWSHQCVQNTTRDARGKTIAKDTRDTSLVPLRYPLRVPEGCQRYKAYKRHKQNKRYKGHKGHKGRKGFKD